MKKIVMLFLTVILLTGCSAQYNLSYYDNIYSENLEILGVKDDSVFVSDIEENLGKVYVVDYTNDYGDMNEQDVINNYSTYNKTLIDENNKYGIKFNYDYKKEDNIINSNIINNLFDSVIINDNYINIYNSKNIFSYYDNLDNITIKFESDKNVKESNADEVKDNICYWYINKDNYENKDIRIIFDNDSKFVSQYKKSVTTFLDYLIYIFLICMLILILVIYNKVKKSNK